MSVLVLAALSVVAIHVQSSICVVRAPEATEGSRGVFVDEKWPLMIEDGLKVTAGATEIAATLDSLNLSRGFTVKVSMTGDSLTASATLSEKTDVASAVNDGRNARRGCEDAVRFVDIGGVISLAPQGRDGLLIANLFGIACRGENYEPTSVKAIIPIARLAELSPPIWHLIAIAPAEEARRGPTKVEYVNLAGGITRGWTDEACLRIGVWRHHDLNGGLIAEEVYESGMRFGQWASWGPRAGSELRGFFENGRKNGNWSTAIRSELEPHLVLEGYLDGNRSGPYREYSGEGLLVAAGQYKNNSAYGTWKFWSSEGLSIREEGR